MTTSWMSTCFYFNFLLRCEQIMFVEVWDRERVVFEGDLHVRERCGETYALWQGEWRRVHNGKEIWLKSCPTRKSPTTMSAVKILPQEPAQSAPPCEARDSFFESLQAEEVSEDSTVVALPDTNSESPWDQSQQDVIHTPKSSRMLVGAGPGTGKTAVACARVAFLINEQECSPNQIFLISFTRTAVAEIRNRIAHQLDDPFLSNSVRILTLDSFAWSINTGFNETATLTGGYDGNIATATSMILNHSLVRDYLADAQHLIVDEAQDIIGQRASFVMAVIDILATDAGFTVFSDDAQAIYGFSAPPGSAVLAGQSVETLPQRLRREKKISCEKNLEKIHRTSSRGLVEIFSNIRSRVLEDTAHPLSKHQEICEQIKQHAHSNSNNTFDPMHFSEEDNSFALFRWKREVLKAVDAFEGRPHRIRMGSIANGVAPWVGAVLGGLDAERVSKSEFLKLWDERNIGSCFVNLEVESAWNDLVEVAGGRQRLDLNILRQNIAALNMSQNMLMHELGCSGPIIGTIHAAKGREAETVYLYFPRLRTESAATDYDEETRVMFVGATRPKKWLHTAVSFEYTGGGQIQRTGRLYEYLPDNKYRLRVMFGLREDILPASLVGKVEFETQEDAHNSQKELLHLAAKIESSRRPVLLFAILNGKRYELKTAEGHLVCTLSSIVKYDLFYILGRLPGKIEKLWLMDVCTLALADNASCLRDLHETWQSGRILLYPRIIGYPLTTKRGK